MSRDASGRFLPNHNVRRRTYPDPSERDEVILTVRVSGHLAERAYAAATRRGVTLSALIRSYLLRLSTESDVR